MGNRTDEAARWHVRMAWICVQMTMPSKQVFECDVLVIGGGPAGLAAAARASQHNQRVIVVDDNPALGGQIWRNAMLTQAPEAARWIDQLDHVQVINGASVFCADFAGPRQVYAETTGALCEFRYQKLILATGARERFIPFPGWTLPGVMGAGGLQALVKGGLPIQGKRVVIAGTGPLLLAVAAYLKEKGAQVCLIAEQSTLSRLTRFALKLLDQPAKMLQFIRLQKALFGIPYLTNCWPTAAHGTGQLAAVTLRQSNRTRRVECDYLATSYYLVPNVELASMLGCAIHDGAVQVNEFQQTTQPAIYAVGEATGIGGVERSVIEGQIAGYAAANQPDLARSLFSGRKRQHQFSQALARTFALRSELKGLSSPDTIICRCEDVTRERLDGYASARAAKLHTRCGMGPCQARICGPIVSFLYGWQDDSIRPPLFPVSIESLAAMSAPIAKPETIQQGESLS
jgi:NADPH-dependent 2,4-dienoyl-CoA reductase/sulfur reductase-like enzyme